jgi:negative regulator of replication initiation
MKNKDKVISLRVEEELAGYIEEQAKEWNMSTSETLRLMISTFYSPARFKEMAQELLNSMNMRIAKAEQEETEVGTTYRLIAREYQETLKPLNDLIDKHMEVSSYLYESYSKSTEYLYMKLREYLKRVKEAQAKQGAEALKEEAMA